MQDGTDNGSPAERLVGEVADALTEAVSTNEELVALRALATLVKAYKQARLASTYGEPVITGAIRCSLFTAHDHYEKTWAKKPEEET